MYLIKKVCRGVLIIIGEKQKNIIFLKCNEMKNQVRKFLIVHKKSMKIFDEI